MSHSIDPHSIASVRIDLLFEETTISTATGFVVAYDTSNYLITNWHNLAGRDANTNVCINRNLAVPNTVRLYFRKKGHYGFVSPVDVALKNESGVALWKQHCKGSSIDVACLQLPSLSEFIVIDPRTGNSNKPLRKIVTANCFIVGYPIPKLDDHDFPVWKSATIASEYSYGYNGKNCFLVDATTSAGMSGSPVYIRYRDRIEYEDGTSFIGFDGAREFLGVYSGRIKSTAEGTLDLGIVWHWSAIDEVLNEQMSVDL